MLLERAEPLSASVHSVTYTADCQALTNTQQRTKLESEYGIFL